MYRKVQFLTILSYFNLDFDVTLTRDIDIANLCVCLSVCLSVCPVLDENCLTYCHRFLPRYAMHKRGYSRRALSVCRSVCLSRSWIMSKRINLSSNFFHRRVATPF